MVGMHFNLKGRVPVVGTAKNRLFRLLGCVSGLAYFRSRFPSIFSPHYTISHQSSVEFSEFR